MQHRALEPLSLDLRGSLLAGAVNLGARLVPLPVQRPEGAAIVACAAAGSLGDEAMIEALSAELGRAGIERRLVLEFAPPGQVGPDVGAFVVRARLAGLASLAPALRSVDEVHVLGADMMDGHYSVMGSVRRVLLAGFAARLGAGRVTIASLGWNASPARQVVAALRGLPGSVRICARDPVSAARLEAALPGRLVERVADLAFLLPPDRTGARFEETSAWLRAEREAGSILLGLNVAGLPDDRGEALLERHVEAVRQLVGQEGRIALLLLPHDTRRAPGQPSDGELALRAQEKLRPLLGERVRCLEAPVRPGTVKALAGQLDLVLSGRMHLAIAALGSGVPVACVGYQDKFEGLFDLFGLDRDLLLTRSDACEPGAVAATARQLLRGRVRLAGQVRERVPEVVRLARGNLAGA